MSDSEKDIRATSAQSQLDLDPEVLQKNLQEKWLQALDEGDLETFKDLLLNHEVDPRYRYHERGTCLEIACSLPGKGPFVRVLLEKVKPTVNNTIILQPIHYAAREGADDAMAELLSHKQTDVNAVTSEEETPLHYLAKYYEPDERYRRCLQLLLNRPDIDINKPNINGYTIIHQAACNNKREIVEAILKNCGNELDLDSQQGHRKAARTFISQMYPDLVPVFPCNKNKSSTAYSKQLLHAFNNRQLDIFRRLLHHVDEEGDAVCDVNYRYGRPYNETCLEMSCRQEGCEEYMKMLLAAGADPNQVNPNTGKAPIHVAAEALNYEALEILLDSKYTNEDAVDKDGRTAKHYVNDYFRNDPKHKWFEEDEHPISKKIRKCYRLLSDHLCIATDPFSFTNYSVWFDVTDGDECLWMMNVIKNLYGELRIYLVKKQEMDFIHKYPHLSKKWRILCEKIQWSEPISIENIFLQLAIENHLTKVVSALLKNGTNPNIVLYKEPPPLIMAVKHEDIEILKLLLSFPNVDVNIRDGKGDTALHHAVRMQNIDIITALLNHGVNIAHENALGKTPLSVNSLQKLLDESIRTNDEYFPGSEDCEVIFDYTLLTASKTEYEETDYIVSYKSAEGQEEAETGQGSGLTNPNGDQKTAIHEKQYPSPVGLKAETEILHYISKHHQHYKNLLNHPVISSFLDFKWNCVSIFFYLNILFYVWFLITLNVYIIYSPSPKDSPEVNNCSEEINNCLGAENSDFVDRTQTTTPVGCMVTFAVLTCILAMREIFQSVTSGWCYWKNIENYLDIAIVSMAVTIMCLPKDDPSIESCHVFAILLSSCELVLLLGRSPLLARNIEMLKTVTGSYISLFLTFLAIILAFSHCLHIVFKQDMNKEGVYSGVWAICRTIVFMTGEYEADDLNFSSMPITSVVVFLLFVFFISIVLLNLLIGLSVNNTKLIEEISEVVCITSRIDLIYDIENIMLRFHKYFKCLNISGLTESVILFPKAKQEKVVIVLPNKHGILKDNTIYNSYSLISAFTRCFRKLLTRKCTYCRNDWKCSKCRNRENPKMDKNILKDALKIISSNSEARRLSNREIN